MSHLIERLNQVTLLLTVTPGRSGTKLLAVLLSDALGLAAAHEPPPRVNFVTRTFLEIPSAAEGWLLTEKLPAMLASARHGFYAETSHLFCKGLIEPLISLGLCPRLLALARPARDVASSLFRMNVIPARTDNGRLVLLQPSDLGVLALPHWERLSDYQLCFWYAREIERRQAVYFDLSARAGLKYMRIDIRDLGSPLTLGELATFCDARLTRGAVERQAKIMSKNQNSRQSASGLFQERELPMSVDDEEAEVDACIASDQLTQRRGAA